MCIELNASTVDRYIYKIVNMRESRLGNGQAVIATRKHTTGRGHLRNPMTDKVRKSAHRGQRARNHSSYLCEEAAPVLSE